jgi:hypothetical protein
MIRNNNHYVQFRFFEKGRNVKMREKLSVEVREV